MAGESILVVDDNALNLKLLRVVLAASGYDVKAAVDAETALGLLATYEPAIILMDVELRTIPIVAVSAHAMSEDRAEAGPQRRARGRARS